MLLALFAPSCLASQRLGTNYPGGLEQTIFEGLKNANAILHHRNPPAVNLHAKSLETPVGPTVKTVTHQKVPGNGYKPGSPLYNVQENKKNGAAPSVKRKKAEPQNGTRQEKLYACVDRALAQLDEAFDPVSPMPIIEDVNACMEKHDATPVEAWGIRERTIKTILQKHWLTALVVAAIFFILVLITAFIYQRSKKDPAPTRYGGMSILDDFQFGMFSCHEAPGMSLLTCCCFAIRWADTMRMASLMSFWLGVILITFLEVCDGLTSGLSMCVAWGIVVFYRQKLRKEFGFEHGTMKSCGLDCCGYCWCACCMAVQEARQLEEAYAVGHPIRKVPAGALGPAGHYG